jgi:hypothetical protein
MLRNIKWLWLEADHLSSISVVIMLQDERTKRGSIAGKGKIFYASPKLADWLWHPPSVLLCTCHGLTVR